MTTAVQQLLKSFDALPDAEKHAATLEILRRVSPEGNIPDSKFAEVADELFIRLDEEEEGHAQR